MNERIHMEQIVNFLLSLNWRYPASVLFGAMVSATIIHILTNRREIKRLRIELQTKTTEQLLDAIKSFEDSSSNMFIKDLSALNGYNITLIYNNEQVENNSNNINDFTFELHLRQMQLAKDRIRKCMDAYRDNWGLYCNSYLTIINILESKEVILNKFVGFKDILLEQFNELASLHKKIMDLYLNGISQFIMDSSYIDDVYINKISDYETDFMKNKIDIHV